MKRMFFDGTWRTVSAPSEDGIIRIGFDVEDGAAVYVDVPIDSARVICRELARSIFKFEEKQTLREIRAASKEV